MVKKKSPDNVQVVGLSDTTDKSVAQKENSLAGVRKRLPGHTPVVKRLKKSEAVASAAAAPKKQVIKCPKQAIAPHFRPHCTSKPLQSDASYSFDARIVVNTQCCTHCLCFVCNVPVAQCTSWQRHCHATDEGAASDYWNRLREDSNPGTAEPFHASARVRPAPKARARRPVSGVAFFRSSINNFAASLLDEPSAVLARAAPPVRPALPTGRRARPAPKARARRPASSASLRRSSINAFAASLLDEPSAVPARAAPPVRPALPTRRRARPAPKARARRPASSASLRRSSINAFAASLLDELEE